MGSNQSSSRPEDAKFKNSIQELELQMKRDEAKYAKKIQDIDVQRKLAEADASKHKADASKNDRKILLFFSVAVPVFLTCDYFFRGTRQGRKILVKSFLYSTCYKFSKPSHHPSRLISHPSREKVLRATLSNSLPTMIIGPTGSGKSTLLSQIQEKFRQENRNVFGIPKPSVFINLRFIGDIKSSKSKTDTTDADGRAIFKAAKNLFRTIGYPLLPPIISRFGMTIFKLLGSEVNLSPTETMIVDQMEDALTILFECMADLGGLVIIDEVLDLLRDDRLKKSGGYQIFMHLTTLIVIYMVNFAQVKGAIAGSSNFLSQEFSKTVASGFRWHKEYISDLPDASVLAYLTASDGLNLPMHVAELIVEKCGTRFRIMNNLAQSHAMGSDIHKSVDVMYGDAKGELIAFVSLAAEYPGILSVLRDMCAGKEVFLTDLPEQLRKVERISKVFYVGTASKLSFQSKIIENLVRELENPEELPKS